MRPWQFFPVLFLLVTTHPSNNHSSTLWHCSPTVWTKLPSMCPKIMIIIIMRTRITKWWGNKVTILSRWRTISELSCRWNSQEMTWICKLHRWYRRTEAWMLLWQKKTSWSTWPSKITSSVRIAPTQTIRHNLPPPKTVVVAVISRCSTTQMKSGSCLVRASTIWMRFSKMTKPYWCRRTFRRSSWHKEKTLTWSSTTSKTDTTSFSKRPHLALLWRKISRLKRKSNCGRSKRWQK